jgi:tetratricopeptide (TPR) repeat protein
MTGLAIVMYLNQTPYQPRERDYAYAGSFYAFSIWIGLGVMFLYSLIKKYMPKPLAAIIITICCLGVPALMAQQNWDDHDRSNRRVARDFGLNYLNSCAPNAIIFSNGDNDTFPLWYNQEVEENRTDMRVCNLSYLNTDWYIDQMKREAYESAPLPIMWDKKDYVSGHLDVSRVSDHAQFANGMELGQALDLVRNPRTIDENGIGNFFSSTMILPVDKQKVIETGTVEAKDSTKIVDKMHIKLGRSVGKAQLMVLEMLNSNNWERPIYVAATVGSEYYPALQEYMQLEGLAYRIVPVKGQRERVNTEVMYDNMMNKFVWGNIADPNVYLDEQHIRMARTMRMMFAQLAEALINEGQEEKALEVLEKCLKEIPTTTVPADYSIAILAEHYYALGQTEKADNLIRPIFEDCIARIEWVNKLKPTHKKAVSQELSIRQNIGLIQNLWMTARNYNSTLTPELEENFQKYYPLVRN